MGINIDQVLVSETSPHRGDTDEFVEKMNSVEPGLIIKGQSDAI